MALNLRDNLIKILKENPNQRFTAHEIADWVISTFPEECREKEIKSKTNQPIHKIIRGEVSSDIRRLEKRNPEIIITDDRPKKFFFSASSDHAVTKKVGNSVSSTKKKEKIESLSEHDLYPILAEYLWSDSGYRIFSMRINEKRSSNKRGVNGNKWLYPDIVGIEDLSTDWDREIKDCVQVYSDKKSKLWSFEVKKHIDSANVRQAFFQAVSNSSWANFSYLVAEEIKGADTQKELRMLSSLHGIGFISLDIENPSESKIVIPAKERVEIDWDTVNRLAKENKDFLEYIKHIRKFYQTGDLPKK